MKQQRSLGKRRENLEGLWGELASSFTNMGGSGEATLLTYNLQPTDETLYEKTYGNSFRHCGRGPRWQTLPWQLAGRECCLQQNHDFRFIDHGDSKFGLSSTNQMDHVVSTEFFDQEKQDLKREALEVEFKQLWPDSSAARVHRTSYEDFGET